MGMAAMARGWKHFRIRKSKPLKSEAARDASPAPVDAFASWLRVYRARLEEASHGAGPPKTQSSEQKGTA